MYCSLVNASLPACRPASLQDLVSPVLLGQEHLPGLVGCGRPLLFVGNHQKCGLYDMPLLAYELYLRGFKVRFC
jgi:1-acyl-sn-glycerol-3-phosphate acyltransferase